MLCGEMRDGLESYLPREEMTRSAMHVIMRWETRSISFPFIGEGKYSMTEYDKLIHVYAIGKTFLACPTPL